MVLPRWHMKGRLPLQIVTDEADLENAEYFSSHNVYGIDIAKAARWALPSAFLKEWTWRLSFIYCSTHDPYDTDIVQAARRFYLKPPGEARLKNVKTMCSSQNYCDTDIVEAFRSSCL